MQSSNLHDNSFLSTFFEPNQPRKRNSRESANHVDSTGHDYHVSLLHSIHRTLLR